MMTAHRPGKGSILKVDPIRSDPIRSLEAIAAIKALLADQPRNLLLFVLGINTNLRVCDLLGICLGQVRGLQVGETLVLRESKTNKIRRITLNGAVAEALQPWLAHCAQRPDACALFWSRKTGQALRVAAVNNLIKSWCRAVGLQGRFGCHSLRKTFGYMHRTRFGTDLPTLMVLFNHSTQRQTLDYLGIEDVEVSAAYRREI